MFRVISGVRVKAIEGVAVNVLDHCVSLRPGQTRLAIPKSRVSEPPRHSKVPAVTQTTQYNVGCHTDNIVQCRLSHRQHSTVSVVTQTTQYSAGCHPDNTVQCRLAHR
jgi:hypothetical protein